MKNNQPQEINTHIIEAIFFDLDGTLLDTASDLLFALNYLLEKYNFKTITLEQLLPLISYGSKKIINSVLNLDINDKQLELLKSEFIDAYHKLGHQHTQLFPGMEKVLVYLNNNNIKWGIITNKTTKLAIPVVEQLKLTSLNCKTVVCADTTDYPKPHPAPMLKACQDLNVNPKNCLFIGDAKTDIEAGKAVGMHTILAAYGYIPPKDDLSLWGADFTVYSTLEILKIIAKN